MNVKTLEERIKTRASEVASGDIHTFKKAIDAALNVLCQDAWDARKKCLEVMSSGDNTKGWPKLLWEVREKNVRDDIFRTMDSVQRMLASKGGGENAPEVAPT